MEPQGLSAHVGGLDAASTFAYVAGSAAGIVSRERTILCMVLAIFRYDVKPGRMADFMAKLQEAAGPKFDSPVMPHVVRLFRSTVPGSDTGPVFLHIEYPDMAAYGARTAFENSNGAWKKLFAAQPDSPETLVSVELLTELS